MFQNDLNQMFLMTLSEIFSDFQFEFFFEVSTVHPNSGWEIFTNSQEFLQGRRTVSCPTLPTDDFIDIRLQLQVGNKQKKTLTENAIKQGNVHRLCNIKQRIKRTTCNGTQ